MLCVQNPHTGDVKARSPKSIPRHNQGPLGKVLPSWATIHTFRDLRNGPFLRGLLHESTVRRRKGCLWVPYIISAQRNSTLAGCLMSPLCGDSRVSAGIHISSSHSGTLCFCVDSPTKYIPYRFGGCRAVWRPAGHACRRHIELLDM